MSNIVPSSYIGNVEVYSDLSSNFAAAIQTSISTFNNTESLARHLSSSTASVTIWTNGAVSGANGKNIEDYPYSGGSGHFKFGGDLKTPISTPGMENVYLSLTKSSGALRSPDNVARTFVHEILHGSPEINKLSEGIVDAWAAEVQAGGGVTPLSNDDRQQLALFVEHVIIAGSLKNIYGEVNIDANNLDYYVGKLEEAAKEYLDTGKIPKIVSTTAWELELLAKNGKSVVDHISEIAGAIADGIGNFARAVAGAVTQVFEAIFGPGGNSNSPGHTERTSWTDTDGRPHWGSVTEYERAVKKDKVDRVGVGDEVDGSDNNDGIGNTANDDDWSQDGANGGGGLYPILLDLDGTGISITERGNSSLYLDGGDGRQHRTAWAGAGDGVLFFDAGMDGKITEKREYVFTEWTLGSTSDLEAVREAFDTNGDGRLTAADAQWGGFKVMVTNPDGTVVAKTLAQLGITDIDLRPDATHIELPDGSVITGHGRFTMGGVTRTVANTTLSMDAGRHRVVRRRAHDTRVASEFRFYRYRIHGRGAARVAHAKDIPQSEQFMRCCTTCGYAQRVP